MVFARDTEANLSAAVDLVNTARRRDGRDAMSTVADLGAFYERWGYSVRHDGDEAELRDVRAARDQVAHLWDVERDEAAHLVNAILRESDAVPFLTRHDALDWHLHATVPDAPLATVILVETAMGVVDVIRSDEYERMRRCAGEDCRAVLVDLSRNRSRRFCEVNNCGNRAHVAAYRARHRDA
ncbi:CGNR zinc finger domain-containing protein [Cellulomonas palmilytica]|uniref:CGNR zinc finger domain-containing protein n=1 Tax=Cellulomonas palmilytica TaxID=2608402 RepID=UPI001F20E498|nr:CGNR zinc finger domain-containing protein [Cellulomonas palmilytica]UJP38633.1 CGNR zinc finger domain-containing protein [Cellulomonas palmilytica]